jgi:hypothetical protein
MLALSNSSISSASTSAASSRGLIRAIIGLLRFPNFVQILDRLPPANSPPLRVEFVPSSRHAYSGGGDEAAGWYG